MVLWIYRRCCCRGLNSSSEKMTSARMALGSDQALQGLSVQGQPA